MPEPVWSVIWQAVQATPFPVSIYDEAAYRHGDTSIEPYCEFPVEAYVYAARDILQATANDNDFLSDISSYEPLYFPPTRPAPVAKPQPMKSVRPTAAEANPDDDLMEAIYRGEALDGFNIYRMDH